MRGPDASGFESRSFDAGEISMKKQRMQYFLPAALALGMATTGYAQNAETIQFADGTAVPVLLTHTVYTAKAKTGDSVTAKTMQVVYANHHMRLARGAVVMGHVVSVTRYNGAAGQAANLVLLFDQARSGSATIPVRFQVRAVASSYEAYDAEYLTVPQLQSPYTHTLIGGERTTPGSKVLTTADGDTIGYENKNGRFGALMAASAESMTCAGVAEPQSIAIFAPEACGTYGFDHVTMQQEDSGAVRLTARRHDITLFSGSAMLLQARSGNEVARR
jgi:hypothetical protein